MLIWVGSIPFSWPFRPNKCLCEVNCIKPAKPNRMLQAEWCNGLEMLSTVVAFGDLVIGDFIESKSWTKSVRMQYGVVAWSKDAIQCCGIVNKSLIKHTPIVIGQKVQTMPAADTDRYQIHHILLVTHFLVHRNMVHAMHHAVWLVICLNQKAWFQTSNSICVAKFCAPSTSHSSLHCSGNEGNNSLNSVFSDANLYAEARFVTTPKWTGNSTKCWDWYGFSSWI